MTVPILGLDPSVTSTGIAWPDGTTNTLRPPTPLRGGERLHWIDQHLARTIRTHPPQPRIAIVEDYSRGLGKGGPTVMLRLGEAGGIIRALLHRLDIPIVEIPPPRLKRYATGRGNADKDSMRAALAPEVSARCATGDEVDARWLWHLGQLAYNGHATAFDHQLEVVADIDWPVIR